MKRKMIKTSLLIFFLSCACFASYIDDATASVAQNVPKTTYERLKDKLFTPLKNKFNALQIKNVPSNSLTVLYKECDGLHLINTVQRNLAANSTKVIKTEYCGATGDGAEKYCVSAAESPIPAGEAACVNVDVSVQTFSCSNPSAKKVSFISSGKMYNLSESCKSEEYCAENICKPKCIDSDAFRTSGQPVSLKEQAMVAGYTNVQGITFIDACKDASTIRESRCVAGNEVKTEVNCASIVPGSTCVGGPLPKCSGYDTQPDYDKDLVKDMFDNCPTRINADQLDVDSDGFGDKCDNCSGIANSDQTDADYDDIGNACDCATPSILANVNGDQSPEVIAQIVELITKSSAMIPSNTNGVAEYDTYSLPCSHMRIVCQKPCAIPEKLLKLNLVGAELARKKLVDLTKTDVPYESWPVDIHISSDHKCGNFAQILSDDGYVHRCAGTYDNGGSYMCLWNYDDPNLFIPFNETTAATIQSQLTFAHEYTHLLSLRLSTEYLESFAKALSFYVDGSATNACSEQLSQYESKVIYDLCNNCGFALEDMSTVFAGIKEVWSNSSGFGFYGAADQTNIKMIVDDIVGKDSATQCNVSWPIP